MLLGGDAATDVDARLGGVGIWSVVADDVGPSFFKDIHACPVLTRYHIFPTNSF